MERQGTGKRQCCTCRTGPPIRRGIFLRRVEEAMKTSNLDTSLRLTSFLLRLNFFKSSTLRVSMPASLAAV